MVMVMKADQEIQPEHYHLLRLLRKFV